MNIKMTLNTPVKQLTLLLLSLLLVACGGGSGSSSNSTDSAGSSDSSNGSTDNSNSGNSNGTAGKAPNILLIIADDMGLDASPVHSVGSLKPNMPILESLSKNGVTFDNLWVNPLCTPTRASLLTGKYGINSGVVGVTAPFNGVSTSEVSLQTYLKEEASYNSAVIGKWHLSNNSNGGADNPEYMGIEHYSGMLSGAHTDYYDWTLTENGQSSNVTEYSTSYFTDEGIDWIKEQETGSNADKPWFLWMAYTAPHTPFHLPPKNLISDQSLSGDADDIASNPLDYYFAMLEAMDTEMGRLLQNVDMDNTVVIFIGDNGTPALAVQSPYSRTHAKGSVYEGGVNTPMVVSGKGVSRSNQRESALINGVDLFSTITEIAGTGLTAVHDSRSFNGLLNGGANTARTYNYTEVVSNKTAWAVRDQQYKLIEFDGDWQEFYDLNNDPYENNELIDAGLNAEQSAAKDALEALSVQIRGGN